MDTTPIKAQVTDGSTIPWQQILQNSFKSLDRLLDFIDISPADFSAQYQSVDSQAFNHFPIKVPRPFAERMVPGDLNDPLLRQVLPQAIELSASPGYSIDPLGERNSSPIEGLLHKYYGRVLLVTTSSCAIHCRYCFRQHFPYDDHRASKQHWLTVFDYIRKDTTIKEIILSGGDPLNCSDSHLSWLSQQLETIPHLTTLRIHTRFPIVIPERINSEFINWTSKSKLKIVMVLHCNHPNEIDLNVSTAISKLNAINILLLNQSVLLKGVNDNVDTLVELSEKLFQLNIQPYYLHLLDKVTGAAHFDTENHRAEQLYQQLLLSLPGYLVPKMVREIDGTPAKVPITVPFNTLKAP